MGVVGLEGDLHDGQGGRLEEGWDGGSRVHCGRGRVRKRDGVGQVLWESG